MDVTCPACAARYTADEQKLRGKTARMRCRACDTVWLVSGPEDVSMSEPKRAAVVKRGADRENRDLFAVSSRADYGSVKETMHPPPPDSTFGGVAARNESSVLFTVDALKGSARVKTPEPERVAMAQPYMSSSFKSDDDDGVIDLMSLSSAPPKAGARPVAALFTSEPPPAAFAADVSDSGAHGQGGFKFGKRAFIGMAAAAVAIVLCTLGLAAAFKGEEPAVRTAAAMAPATPPAPPVVTAPPPAATQAAAVPASSSSDDDDEKSSKKGKGKGKAKASGVKNHSGGGVAKAKLSSEPAKPAATPKAADKCGCKGDFNCILRCTAKGS